MRFSLPRFKLPSVEFEGELLAEVSTEEPGEPRWTECAIYKTKGGQYVTQMTGRTEVEGEHDILNVRIYRNPAMVRQGFMRTDREEGHRYMTDAGFEVLEIAHEKDPAIALGVLEID